MKNFLLLVLCFALTVVSGCSKSQVNSESQAESSDSISEKESSDNNSSFDNESSDDSNTENITFGDGITVTTKPKILTAGNKFPKIEEKFIEKYGMPAETAEGYAKTKHPVTYIKVLEYDLYYKLHALKSSDDSPDCIFIPDNSWMYMNKYYDYSGKGLLLENASEYFDFSKHEWDRTRRFIIEQTLNGYMPPIFNYELADVLWYSEKVISEYNLEDPFELYQKNEWTWEKLSEMYRAFFKDIKKRNYKIGYTFPNSLLCTSGNPAVSYENGIFVNNFKKDTFKDAIDFLCNFRDEFPSLFSNDSFGFSVKQISADAKDPTLFASYAYGSDVVNEIDKNPENSNMYKFVPLPSITKDSTGSQKVKLMSFFPAKGMKNLEGYKALVYSALQTYYEESMDVSTDMARRYHDVINNSELIVDYNDAIGLNQYNEKMDVPREDLRYGFAYHAVFFNCKDYNELSQKHETHINYFVNSANEIITGG